MTNLDYDGTKRLETLQAIAYTTADRAETYDKQLNLIYEWVKTGVISKRLFKNLLTLLVG